MKVFLGGTCGKSTWRDEVAVLLHRVNLECFNPQTLGDLRPERFQVERIAKSHKCSLHLYVITCEGGNLYSVAEAVESAAKGYLTVVQVVPTGFTDEQLRSLNDVLALLTSLGAHAIVSETLSSAVNILKTFKHQ